MKPFTTPVLVAIFLGFGFVSERGIGSPAVTAFCDDLVFHSFTEAGGDPSTDSPTAYSFNMSAGQSLPAAVALHNRVLARSPDCRWLVSDKGDLVDLRDRRATPLGIKTGHFIFSPDSRRLVYQSERGLEAFDLQTSRGHSLGASLILPGPRSIAFSRRKIFTPDSRFLLAYELTAHRRRSPYILSLDGNESYPISVLDSEVADLSFSPDGSRVIVLTYPRETAGVMSQKKILVVDAHGRGLHQIFHTNAAVSGLCVSSDSKQLAIVTQSPAADEPDATSRLYIAGLDGKAAKELLAEPLLNHSVEFSSDATRVLFVDVNQRAGSIRVDGGGRVAIAPGKSLSPWPAGQSKTTDGMNEQFFAFDETGARVAVQVCSADESSMGLSSCEVLSARADGLDTIALFPAPLAKRAYAAGGYAYGFERNATGFGSLVAANLTTGTPQSLSASVWSEVPALMKLAPNGKALVVLFPARSRPEDLGSSLFSYDLFLVRLSPQKTEGVARIALPYSPAPWDRSFVFSLFL